MPELGLQKYDRLIPTPSLPDVSGFEAKIVPFLVKFWRMKKTDRVIHDNPIITTVPSRLYDLWVVDGLHSWALGSLGSYIAFVLRFCLKSKIFRPALPCVDPEDSGKGLLSQGPKDP